MLVILNVLGLCKIFTVFDKRFFHLLHYSLHPASMRKFCKVFATNYFLLFSYSLLSHSLTHMQELSTLYAIPFRALLSFLLTILSEHCEIARLNIHKIHYFEGKVSSHKSERLSHQIITWAFSSRFKKGMVNTAKKKQFNSTILQSQHYLKSIRIWSCSGPYFPAFGLNTKIYKMNLQKYKPEISEFGQFLRSAKLLIINIVAPHFLIKLQLVSCYS